MFRDIPVLGDVSQAFFMVVMVILIIFCILCLIRMIMGPSVADRLLAANMMGGIVIVIICLACVMLKEDFLLDVGLVYALISFLAVIMLSQIYIGVYRARYAKKKAREDERFEQMAEYSREIEEAVELQMEVNREVREAVELQMEVEKEEE